MPSAAERTRTLVQSTCSAVVLVPGAVRAPQDQLMPLTREVTPEGDVHLLFPADAPPVRAATHAQADELSAVLELTDVAPVAVPHRIRGRAWVSGWLTRVPGQAEPGRMMLRLEVGEISVDDLWGSDKVEPEAFAEALADPLTEHEAELLQHLHTAHSEQVGLLGSLLGERAGLARTEQAVPLALDRFGLRIRFAGEGQCFDARFDFPEPVRDVTDLRRAMHQLFTAAAS
ncbi:DUF2470 domain-containing protein [Streptomyces sp. TRM66268-LWL]|uniref:DUF2470 domain-containing protein n=1 Tax=Streptomyces polyasparticus TaxID=2767826 RepID=A0ABR7SM29_9ACTN|nr:DUF2470 domain-containing protein [Streptomyces polyasparticus]MBC9715647.1 DUF2470 domain-containing protein [Streptomyces polyasparticus]